MKKWKCLVCGYIHSGEEPPEKCPVCGADKSKFVEVTEEEEVIEATSETTGSSTGNAKTTPATLYRKAAALVLKYHLHPISVHTPNGLLPVAVIFLGLAIVFHLASFELAAFYNLVFVLLSMPVVIATGYMEWQERYQGSRTTIFLAKLCCAAVVLVTLTIGILWRLIDPDVAGAASPSRWMFMLLNLVMLGAAGVAGHLGGKLVFNRRDG